MDLPMSTLPASFDMARQAAESAMPAALASLSRAGGAEAGGDAEAPRFRDMVQARKAAEDFEAFYLSQMMQPMFSGLKSEPPFGGGHAESTWRSLLVDEYGRIMARGGGVGVADAVMRTMLDAQSQSGRPTAAASETR
jgi:Rod binding domain-containing protein